MVRSVPRCAHCKRPMSGASSADRFCSDACALAFAPKPPAVDGLAETLKLWRKRATEPEPDSTVTHWTPAAAFHFQSEAAARMAPPLPEPGDDAGFPCPSCEEPMIVLVSEPDRVVVKCPRCKVSETRRP